MTKNIFTICWCVSLAISVSSTHPLIAAPTITNLSPRGLQIGKPQTIVITGSDLSADTRLIIPAEVAAQAVKPGAKPGQIELEVTLSENVQPGLYAIRLANAKGVSSPAIVGVDWLPQVAMSDSLPAFPVALHGAIGGAEVLKAKFTGKQGQLLVIDCESQRLGSKLKPVVRLYDARGNQVAWSPPKAILGGDPRCEVVLPADGPYQIELHDQLYKSASPGFFRLKVGDLSYADLTLPLAVTLGSKQPVKFAATNLKQAADQDATSDSLPGQRPAKLPAAANFTGAAPQLTISDFPELLEAATSPGKLQQLSPAPVGISGTISAKGEEDKYQLTVTPGSKLRFSVVARQVGSPLDGVLSIRNEQGAQLASGDDRPGNSDPLVDFTVPAGTTKLQIALKDLSGAGGPEFVYRIEVQDQARPSFTLSLPTDKLTVPAGGTQVVPVQVARSNYAGPISLALENLPSQLHLQGDTIPAGATIGLLTLSADAGSPLAGLTRLVGRAQDASTQVARPARFDEFPGSDYQPYLREQLAYAISEPSPITVAWTAKEGEKLLLGAKFPAKVQLTRAAGTPGKVRIRLLTTQPMPKKTVKEGNKDKVVDDLDRALRLEGDPVLEATQSDATVNILVPADLPPQTWDLVLVADLLSADAKKTVTSIAAPVRTLATAAPFTIELAGSSAAEGKAGAGEAGQLTGKLVRQPGFNQPVVVTLESLPRGYTAPQVFVPADKSDFALPLTFAFGAKPGNLKGAKLVALAAPVTAASVRSNSVDVAVKVIPGEKPVAEQPKEVFEDDEKFIGLLTEGEGRAIPEMRDKYSGTYSLRVTPDGRSNAKLPNLGVKIRENPGPGEFRFIRFAWKKTGGNSICLQLNHDGAWGPPAAGTAGSGREGAKFRYHAGPGPECYGAALKIDDQLPGKFEVVTRDLFADFGEFTLTGLGFSPVDGNAALFDHIYLARQPSDFELLKKE